MFWHLSKRRFLAHHNPRQLFSLFRSFHFNIDTHTHTHGYSCGACILIISFLTHTFCWSPKCPFAANKSNNIWNNIEIFYGYQNIKKKFHIFADTWRPMVAVVRLLLVANEGEIIWCRLQMVLRKSETVCWMVQVKHMRTDFVFKTCV